MPWTEAEGWVDFEISLKGGPFYWKGSFYVGTYIKQLYTIYIQSISSAAAQMGKNWTNSTILIGIAGERIFLFVLG